MTAARRTEIGSMILAAILGMAMGFLTSIARFDSRLSVIETRVELMYNSMHDNGWLSAPNVAQQGGPRRGGGGG